MPDRAPPQGPPAVLRPDEPRRGRPTEAIRAGRLLSRPRLLTALSRAVERAPVSGPVGSGKTVLVSSWARRAAASTAVAWVRLGRDDVRLATGRSNTQLAGDLAVSTNTVRGHVRTLQRRLTAPTRNGIIGRARELGLL